MVDDVNVGDLPDEMQKYVKTRTYIGIKDVEIFRKKLLYAMPQKPIKDYDTEQDDDYNPRVSPLFIRMFDYREYSL